VKQNKKIRLCLSNVKKSEGRTKLIEQWKQITEKCVLGKIGLHKAVSQFYKNRYISPPPTPHKIVSICILFWTGLAVTYIPLSEV
jgi:hypothetical protein